MNPVRPRHGRPAGRPYTNSSLPPRLRGEHTRPGAKTTREETANVHMRLPCYLRETRTESKRKVPQAPAPLAQPTVAFISDGRDVLRANVAVTPPTIPEDHLVESDRRKAAVSSDTTAADRKDRLDRGNTPAFALPSRGQAVDQWQGSETPLPAESTHRERCTARDAPRVAAVDSADPVQLASAECPEHAATCLAESDSGPGAAAPIVRTQSQDPASAPFAAAASSEFHPSPAIGESAPRPKRGCLLAPPISEISALILLPSQTLSWPGGPYTTAHVRTIGPDTPCRQK